MSTGHFVISLDFELYWGVRDTRTLADYGQNILGVRQAIPAMLDVFEKYGVRATFATVGMLFAKNKAELIEFSPANKPQYANPHWSPYGEYLNRQVGADEASDPYHYGRSLIDEINRRGHEVACHTFSHYYCLEEGQTLSQFRDDLQAARNIAAAAGITLKSIVFPRNQYANPHLQVCHEVGITSFRGQPLSWAYTSANKKDYETPLRRIVRLIDTYFNLTGPRCYDNQYMASFRPVNIASTSFLRPFKPKFRRLAGLGRRRITQTMTYAARHGLTYHLWWHPHNFGRYLPENLGFLEQLLAHYQRLHREHGFASKTMCDLSSELAPR